MPSTNMVNGKSEMNGMNKLIQSPAAHTLNTPTPIQTIPPHPFPFHPFLHNLILIKFERNGTDQKLKTVRNGIQTVARVVSNGTLLSFARTVMTTSKWCKQINSQVNFVYCCGIFSSNKICNDYIPGKAVLG